MHRKLFYVIQFVTSVPVRPHRGFGVMSIIIAHMYTCTCTHYNNYCNRHVHVHVHVDSKPVHQVHYEIEIWAQPAELPL